MMTDVQTISSEQGRVSVETTTIAISHDLYDVSFSLIHSSWPLNRSDPTVHRGNAASTKQMSVSETMTSLARRVVDRVPTLSG